jgi:ectoine hydroxylase-related dioxygenase (phytanoyl-CoA dioxygenase family)
METAPPLAEPATVAVADEQMVAALPTREPMTIPAAEIAAYHRLGYAKVENVLTEQEVRALQAVTDGFLEQSRATTTHTEIFDLEPGHTPEFPKLRRIKNPGLNHPLYMHMIHHPIIARVVEQFFGKGRGVRTNGDKLNMKSPGIGSPVQWHQDWAFYPHTNDDILAVGLAIDDTTVENGATQFCPGSHLGPILNHHLPENGDPATGGFFCGGVTDPAFNAEGAVSVPVRAGGISLHAGRMLHGSPHNHSDKPRRILFMQYTAMDAFPLLGIADHTAFFNGDVVIGNGVDMLVPRITICPVRMPFPPAPTERSGSIYANQTLLPKALFAWNQDKAVIDADEIKHGRGENAHISGGNQIEATADGKPKPTGHTFLPSQRPKM